MERKMTTFGETMADLNGADEQYKCGGKRL